MRAASSILLVSLATLSLGCSDTAGPDVPASDAQPAPLLDLAPSTATIHRGETLQFTAALKRGAALSIGESAVTWFSSNESVATVTSGGLVLGVNAGATEIGAIWGSARARARVTVLENTIDGSGPHGCLRPLRSGDRSTAKRPAC